MRVVGVTRIMTKEQTLGFLQGFCVGILLAIMIDVVVRNEVQERQTERELNNCLIFASTFDASTGADIRDACIAVAYP